MRFSSLIFIVVLASLATIAAAQQAGTVCDVPFGAVLSLSHSGVTQPEFRVIDDENDWCAFWEQVYGNVFPTPACDRDTIDFDEEVAVIAALGSRPNGCYSVAVTCVERLGNSAKLRVITSETVPGPGCACTQAIAYPLDVVKVRRPAGRVNFVPRTELISCR